jgi:hypothetical protein
MKKRELIAWMIATSLLLFIGFMAPRYVELKQNEQITVILNSEYIRRLIELQTATEKTDSATAMLYNVQIYNLEREKQFMDTVKTIGYLRRYNIPEQNLGGK